MGSKTTVKSRLKGTAYKCDLCGRKFISQHNLKTHQRWTHNIQPKKTQPKPVEVKTKMKKVEHKKDTQDSESKRIIKPTVDVAKLESVSKVDEESSTKDQAVVEFECPKCFRRFHTYFLSLKHIQKFHCVNKQGVKVAPNSPSLIQPLRIELCPKCKKKVHSISTHICDLTTLKTCLSESILYTCTACDQSFNTLRNFDSHVVWLHADDVESIFFPTTIEFKSWKQEMETQTNVKYTDVDKYDSKFFYHCSYKVDPTSSSSANNICPSTLVVQEYTKGIQVHLYKKHYKHCFVDYNLGNKYKKYSINTYLKNSRDKLAPSSKENETFLKFKSIMEKIVSVSAKIDQASLKILLDKASNMTTFLDNIQQENKESDSANTSKNMTDTQITEALEETSENSNKRKLDVDFIVEDVPVIKRTRNNQEITNSSDTSSPKIINSFSLADNANVLEEINKENDIIITQDIYTISNTKNEKQNDSSENNADMSLNSITATNNNTLDQSMSSFNESYTDFLVKTFNSDSGENKKPRVYKKKTNPNNNSLNKKADKNINNMVSDEKPIVKANQNLIMLGSKIVTSPSQSKKNIEQNKKITEPSFVNKGLLEISKGSSQNVSSVQKNKKKNINTQGKKTVPDKNKKNSNPVLINKALLSQNKKNKNEKKKNIMKTKIGQFTKTISPKKVIPKSKPQAKPKISSKPISVPRLSIDKPKVFVDYEVQEQEDDCNILILKI